jgi:MOSC domain-containing protein YiiM
MHVEAIFIAPAGGQPMIRLDEVPAEPGGLVDDRYATRRGYWTGVDECQVTFIEGEVLDEVPARYGVAVAEGQHRRNIVTRGVDLASLAGTRFRVGGAVFAYGRPRPPCRYVESITEPGMTRALGARRGGICADVVEAGQVRVGDEIEVLAASPARRLLTRWF